MVGDVSLHSLNAHVILAVMQIRLSFVASSAGTLYMQQQKDSEWSSLGHFPLVFVGFYLQYNCGISGSPIPALTHHLHIITTKCCHTSVSWKGSTPLLAFSNMASYRAEYPLGTSHPHNLSTSFHSVGVIIITCLPFVAVCIQPCCICNGPGCFDFTERAVGVIERRKREVTNQCHAKTNSTSLFSGFRKTLPELIVIFSTPLLRIHSGWRIIMANHVGLRNHRSQKASPTYISKTQSIIPTTGCTVERRRPR